MAKKKKLGLGIFLICIGSFVMLTLSFVFLTNYMKNKMLWWWYVGIIVLTPCLFFILKALGSGEGMTIKRKGKVNPKLFWEKLVEEIFSCGDLDGHCIVKGGKMTSYNEDVLYVLSKVIVKERSGEDYLFLKFWKGCPGRTYPMGTHFLYVNLNDVDNIDNWNFDFYPYNHSVVNDFRKHYGNRLIKKSFEEDPQVALARGISELAEEDPDILKKKAVESMKSVIVHQQVQPAQPQPIQQIPPQPPTGVIEE